MKGFFSKIHKAFKLSSKSKKKAAMQESFEMSLLYSLDLNVEELLADEKKSSVSAEETRSDKYTNYIQV